MQHTSRRALSKSIGFLEKSSSEDRRGTPTILVMSAEHGACAHSDSDPTASKLQRHSDTDLHNRSKPHL